MVDRRRVELPDGSMERCLVKGCPWYGKWSPVGKDDHYLTQHYQPDPTQPQPVGTQPDKANL